MAISLSKILTLLLHPFQMNQNCFYLRFNGTFVIFGIIKGFSDFFVEILFELEKLFTVGKL
jgi:hypothetical protein